MSKKKKKHPLKKGKLEKKDLRNVSGGDVGFSDWSDRDLKFIRNKETELTLKSRAFYDWEKYREKMPDIPKDFPGKFDL